MRRLVSFTPEAEDRYLLFDQENRPLVSDDFFHHESRSGYMVYDAQAEGYYQIELQDGIPFLKVYFMSGLSFENACGCLASLVESCMEQYHPERICMEPLNAYLHVMQANRFFQKGTIYQRKTEPWRKRLKDSVFDEEGYLIDQGAMEEIPFGWFRTREKGCGWIAAYNLCKMCGREQTMQETAEELSRYALLGGVMGQELYTLQIYLRKKGIHTHVSMSLDASALACIQKSRYGILLYSHRQGAHYTAYRNLGSGRLQFYNAIYGKRNHYQSAEEFLKQHELLPFSSVIYVK